MTEIQILLLPIVVIAIMMILLTAVWLLVS